MAANIELIAKIVQKNGGTFKLLDAVNIDWAGFSFADLGTDALAAMKVYTIEQTNSKIAEAIAAAPHLKRTKVDALPAVEDADENYIYMVKRATSTTSPDGIDAYDEYMLIDGAFEHIGSTVVDLSGYIKTTDAEAKIAAALLEAKNAASAAETAAKKYADELAPNYATAEQGGKADTALQKSDIAEGAGEGTISVKGTDVAVHGLGTAAFQNTDAFDQKGAAAAAEQAAKEYAEGLVDGIDLTQIDTNKQAIEDLQGELNTTNEGVTKNAQDIVTANQKITKNTEDIAKLNGDAETEGSVAKQVKDAADALQAQIDAIGDVNAEGIGQIIGDVAANKAAIEKLNGDAETEGSVDKKVKDAVDAAKEELQGNIDTVSGKADTAQAAADAAQGAAEAAQGTADANAESIKNLEPRVKANEDAIAVLNGDAETEGSVAKQVANAVAGIINGAPEAYNTLKEISDWIAAHPESVADLNGKITANTNLINNLTKLVGTLPEGKTDVVTYINEVLATANAAQTAANNAQAAAEAAQGTANQGVSDAAAAKAAADAAQEAADAAQGAADAAQGTANQAKAKADTALQGIAGVEATVGDDKVATVTGISVDLLKNGNTVLVLTGGNAF